MKRALSNFIRGSQLIEHNGQMLVASTKGPLIATALAWSWLAWWQVTAALDDHQIYLIWMKAYASMWAFMDFDPAKHVTMQSGLGGTFQMMISRVPDFPPVVTAWDALKAALLRATGFAVLLAVPATGAFYWYATRFGKLAKATKHKRGARLVTRDQLVAEIEAHNGPRQAVELRELLGAGWRLTSRAERDAAGIFRAFELAGVPWPWRQEQTHAMLVGATGTGKTVAMMDLIDQIRSRGQRAIVFDLTGAYISTYYDPARDTILHPLDARCPRWSIFDECKNPAELINASQALIPHDGGGAEQFWVLGARTMFVATCIRLIETGDATNEALARELMTADLSRIHDFLKGTIAEPLTAPEAARMGESVRAVFNVNAQALLYLPKSGSRFSIRDWVREGKQDGAILFVSARYVDLAICRQLLTLWLDCAVNTLMSMSTTRDLRLWFLLDELGALHRLPALENGLQTARNFGGAFVTGVHTQAKLKEIYGDNGASNLSAGSKTKLILGNSDRASAEWCSEFIGYGEVLRTNEGVSFSASNARDAVSLSSERREEKLVMPEEIDKLVVLA